MGNAAGGVKRDGGEMSAGMTGELEWENFMHVI